ncbi:MAG: hypothetical protein SGJ09_09910 [Phycisphaerae bacterium]|nr:hypothetical protein [Phycisphaerae bacterium]
MRLPRGHDRPHPSLRDVSRCVIVARGDDLPSGFLALLESRAISTVIRSEPLDAFAQLVRWSLDDRTGGSWGLPQRRVALVVASRDRWESLDRLLRAIAQHFPDVSVWIGTDELLLEISPARTYEAFAGEKTNPPPPPLRLAGTSISPSTDEPPPFSPLAEPNTSEFHSDPTPRNPKVTEQFGFPAAESEGGKRPESKPHVDDAAVTADEIEMLLRLFDDEESDRSPPHQSP